MKGPQWTNDAPLERTVVPLLARPRATAAGQRAAAAAVRITGQGQQKRQEQGKGVTGQDWENVKTEGKPDGRQEGSGRFTAVRVTGQSGERGGRGKRASQVGIGRT